MRSVDERCSAVRDRAKRLRRRRDGRAASVVAALALLSLVDLAGRTASGGIPLPPSTEGGLFGAASLFGPNAGGYVLVALAAAVVAVLVTVFFMARHRPKRDDDKGKSGEALSEASSGNPDTTNEGNGNEGMTKGRRVRHG